MYQFSFNIFTKPTYNIDDFVVSSANLLAYSYIEKWPDWGVHQLARILYIYGPQASGKTHLAHIFQQKSDSLFLEKITLLNANKQNYILDDIENYLHDQKAIFHLINQVIENNSYLLITARFSPSNLPITLPDLASRLNSIPNVQIQEPDDDLLKTVLIKHFADRQLRINIEVINYILSRIERSFTSMYEIVELIDKSALSLKRNITISFVKSLLEPK